jgi:hypothetical protein
MIKSNMPTFPDIGTRFYYTLKQRKPEFCRSLLIRPAYARHNIGILLCHRRKWYIGFTILMGTLCRTDRASSAMIACLLAGVLHLQLSPFLFHSLPVLVSFGFVWILAGTIWGTGIWGEPTAAWANGCPWKWRLVTAFSNQHPE